MALLTSTTITRAGHDIAGAAAAAGGDKFANTGQELVLVKNGHGTDPRTVTLDIRTTVDGQAVTDPTVTVAAGITKAIGPFPTVYNDTDGNVNLTYSDSAANITVKVIKCPHA